MRSYTASAKFIASIATEYTDSCGTARGMISDRYTIKVRIEANQTMTAMLMDHETMKIQKIRNAKTADVRALAASA